MTRLLTVLVLAMCFQGCYYSRARINVTDFHERAAAVKVGQTQASELESIFGTPAFQVMDTKDGRKAHLFVFGDSKTETFNLFFWATSVTNAGIDTAVFVVEDGVVEEARIGENSVDLEWEWWAFDEDDEDED